jgi:hypothetical protein
MKQPEYIEGPKGTENFERGMIALFKVPEDEVVKAEKKAKKKRAAQSHLSMRTEVMLYFLPSQ